MAQALVAPWQLYRHYDAAGTLLYVGISHNALIRLTDHKLKASWFSQIRRIEIEHFPDRASAFAAEAAAIAAEKPKHNRSQANGLVKADLIARYVDRKAHPARAKNSAPSVTRQRLMELLEYLPSTGRFIWRQDVGRNRAGTLAGNVCPKGYWRVGIDGRSYRTHQLAWLYVYGEWADLIDHVNGCKVDNRIANLRKATVSENMANTPVARNNTAGFKGVVPMKNGKWGARITSGGRQQ